MKRSTLLLVEDSRTARALIRATLGEEWKIVEAESGERALRLARLLRPDAALVDIHLDGMSGVELVNQLRQDRDERVRALPVVFLSGSATPEIQEQTEALQGRLLAKPASAVLLRNALAQATGATP